MSFHPRRILPPGLSKKRKEADAFYNPAPVPIKRPTTNPNPSPRAGHPFVKPTPPSAFPTAAAQAKGRKPSVSPAIDNRILAGYMAHEFLTMGTILGQRFDPARAEAVAVSGAEPGRRSVGVAEWSYNQSQGKGKEKEGEEDDKTKTTTTQQQMKKHPSYADVASMLKVERAHIPGVVNPSQLLKWLHQ